MADILSFTLHVKKTFSFSNRMTFIIRSIFLTRSTLLSMKADQQKHTTPQIIYLLYSFRQPTKKSRWNGYIYMYTIVMMVHDNKWVNPCRRQNKRVWTGVLSRKENLTRKKFATLLYWCDVDVGYRNHIIIPKCTLFSCPFLYRLRKMRYLLVGFSYYNPNTLTLVLSPIHY